MLRRYGAGIMLIWVVFSGGPARAGDPNLAEGLFREGKSLMQAGDYAAACPKLAESFQQEPATGTLLALAVCQEASGHLASAWTSYQGVVARASQEGRADRATAARERMAALEPRLSTLTVHVPPEIAARPGLVLTRDGAPLPPAAWGVALPIDAGTHALAAMVDGNPAWQATVTVGGDADRKSVRVTALDVRAAETQATAAAAFSTVEKRRSQDEPPHASSPRGWMRATGIAAASVGVAALGVGTWLGLHARSLNQELLADPQCDKVTHDCDDRGLDLNQRALKYGNAATLAFIAGGALVASGIVLIFIGRSRDGAAPSVSLALPPPTAGRGTGLGLVGTF
jgi:hypothetical protein